MDIQYLLFLQNFRNSINDALTPFMEWLSMFAVTYLVMFAVFQYWSMDKKDGLFTLLSFYICLFLNPLIKLTDCVYRPWIRDARILPAGDAISTATGYSFPSGHTSTAFPLAGGCAVNAWKSKGWKWLAVLFVLYALLTGFSRNYLGVHTPQDVCVGILISLVSLFAAAKIISYLEKTPEKENFFLLAGFILCWLAILYFTLKPYPMDYTADGKLLVDPQKMMNDGYGDVGKLMGFIIARFVEKTWIKFKPLNNGWKGVVICLLGLIPMALLNEFFKPLLVSICGPHWGKLFFSIVYAFYYIAFFPLVLKIISKKVQWARQIGSAE